LKPVVDELETKLGDHIHVIRLNVQENVGRELAPVYGFSFTPTFILFDATGKELWREVGGLDVQRVYESLD
jgi:thioredoxin-related protein